MDRDRSYIINQALDNYLELQRWQIEHIQKALAEADRGEFIPHDDVMKNVRKKIKQLANKK